MKKYALLVICFFHGLSSMDRGLKESYDLRHIIDNLAKQSWMVPDLPVYQRQHGVTAQIAPDILYGPIDLHPKNTDEQPLSSSSSSLQPAPFIDTTLDNNSLQQLDNLEPARFDDKSLIDHHSYFQALTNDHTLIPNWMDKNSWVFPFLPKPDMEKDGEIKNYKQHIKEYNADMLTYDLHTSQQELANLSSLDRFNRYIVSRRISFIMKHVNNTIMENLLAIRNAGQLRTAQNALSVLMQTLKNPYCDAIYVEGKRAIIFDFQEKKKLLLAAHRILSRRRDYQQQEYEAYRLKQEELKKGLKSTLPGGQLSPLDYSSSTETNNLSSLHNSPENTPAQDQFLENLWGTLKINHSENETLYKSAVEETIKGLQQEGILGKDLSAITRFSDISFRFGKGVIRRLNPVVQAKDLGIITWELTKFLAECMVHLDPHYARYRNQQKGYKVMSQIDPEKFLSTLHTVSTLVGGALGVVDQVTFIKAMQPIIDKALQLTAEEWGEITGNLLFPFALTTAVKGVASVGKLAKMHPDVAKAVERVNSLMVSTEPQIGDKLSYLFGKATGSAHNVERSIEMARQLNNIGIFDNVAGNAFIKEHLIKVFNDVSNIIERQDSGRIMRESLLVGPNGALKMQSIWEGNKLITMKLFG